MSTRSRFETVSSKHVADTCPRDHDAELPQLTDDPEIAPARVLARETKDECDDLSIERVGRDVLGRRVGPVSANELPVPPHPRCGRNEEGGPTLASQESGERAGDEGPRSRRPSHLASVRSQRGRAAFEREGRSSNSSRG